MGQSSIFYVFAVLLAGGLLLVSTQRTTTDADRVLASYQHKGIARDAALTGLNLTIRRLVNDTESWKTNLSQYEFDDQSYRGASFSVDVSSPYGATQTVGSCRIDTVDVVATGSSRGGQHVIEATYVRSCACCELPEAFKYALASGGDLSMNGKSKIRGGTAAFNANIHTNLNMSFNDSPTIEGFGTYVGGFSYQDGPPSNFFHPNADTNSTDPDAFQADPLDIPTFDPEDHRATATRVTPDGYTVEVGNPETKDFTNWEGITGYGTQENPFIWFIDGDLSIEANLRFVGVGIVIVNGSVSFNKGAIYNTPTVPPSSTDPAVVRPWIDEHLSEGNTLGLYIGGNLTSNDPGKIVAQVFLNGSVSYNGKDKVYGSIVSRTNISFGNDPNELWYVKAVDEISLFGGGSGGADHARLLSYIEW